MQKQIKWIFNTPAASHHGEVWERCIRSVRKILNSVVRQQTTFMCEVENIINSRPLTAVSNDVKDLQPVTPNMLLCLKEEQPLPPGTEDSFDVYSSKRWRRVQYLANLFWKRWVKEYLPILQKRQKWTKLNPNFIVGDVVIIARRRLKGIHSRSDINRTGAEGLSFYYHRLLHCLDQMLAVMSLSQHRVSSSKTVRPRTPCGARCIGHAVSTWSAV